MRILLSLSVAAAALGLAAVASSASAAPSTNVCTEVARFGADFISLNCPKNTGSFWTPVRYIERGGGSVGASKPATKSYDPCWHGGWWPSEYPTAIETD